MIHLLSSKKKVGLPPGSVVFTGDRKVEKIHLHYLQYNEQEIEEQTVDSETITSFHQPVEDYIQWYDIRGLHDTAIIEEIGKVFKVHPLALEDIADTYQRPKLDEYEEGVFITLKAFTFDKIQRKVKLEQVAFYLGEGYLLTFQEDATDLFEAIRARLKNGRGRIRKRGADYLLYALIDTVIDQYYIALEEVEQVVEEIERDIIERQSRENRTKIYDLKQEMLLIRKTTIPLRELSSQLMDTENELIHENTEPYLRDLRDHIIQTLDLIETYRENLNSLQDLHLSELSFQMNTVMQVLAIVSTIFIPLTFLAGIYGMNFEHMPELQWKYSYFVLLGTMAVLLVAMIWIFKRKKWL
ncbi:MAG: magnesium/cobalt transporter CorA [Bacteroidota bacterium]